MSATDAILTVVILGGALLLLYRSLRRSGGGCHGCSGGCREAKPTGLTTLCRPKREG